MNKEPIDLSHLPPGPARKTEFPKPSHHGPRWNGESVEAIVGTIIMGDTSEFSAHWGKHLEGQRVPCIKIRRLPDTENTPDYTFYIHNEPEGFNKVFCTWGGPFSGGHSGLCVDDESSFEPDERQPKIPDPPTKQELINKIGHRPHKKAMKIGRNDPCACMSGKKWKKCHGRNL